MIAKENVQLDSRLAGQTCIHSRTASLHEARHNRFSVLVDLNNLTATIEAICSHVVTTMTLTSLFVRGNGRGGQGIVGTAHVTLRAGFPVLLYGHGAYSYLYETGFLILLKQ